MENNMHHPKKDDLHKPPTTSLPGLQEDAANKKEQESGPEIIHIGSAGAFSESEGEVSEEQDINDKSNETAY